MDDLFAISRRGNKNNGYIIWSKDQIEFITAEYNKYHSIPTIAKKFNVSTSSIRTVLRKEKVRILNISELKQLEYPRDSDYFEVINSADRAYWLGFLYADGYISKDNTIRINLKKDDEDHLKKFMKAIKYTNGKIKYSEKRDNNKTFYQAYFQVKDKKMAKDLADKGCVNNKSLILTFPYDKIPTNLYSDFIRGYFDGDGCLTYSISGKNKSRNYKINFVGTESFLNSLKTILGKEKLSLEKFENYCSLSINGNKQVKRILDFLYKDAEDDVCLSRKKDKYKDFLSQSFGGEPINIGCE